MVKVPAWEKFMIPILRVLRNEALLHRREIQKLVATDTKLTEEQMKIVLSSGNFQYINRIGWAISFLTNVGALERPSRGNYRITEAGKQLLERFPSGVTEKVVRNLGENPSFLIRSYVATISRNNNVEPTSEESISDDSEQLTPLEQVQTGIERIHDEVGSELLIRLQAGESGFFENAVVKLLLAMGYGGTSGGGSVTQLSHDGGIDGVIDQDVLGINRVYIQAKRYASGNVIQRPDVQGFVGALSGKADRGVFITTSRFSEGGAHICRECSHEDYPY